MPKDGLKRLPDHIVAPLLRALMCIPQTRDARLMLQRPDEPRPPVRQFDRDADFNVLWQGRVIGRIWWCDYSRDTSGEMAHYLWHWRWQHVDERADAQGHTPTLESAMADFRRAWDTARAKPAATK